MAEKVFCENCVYLLKKVGRGSYRCRHAENVLQDETITWLSKKSTKTYVRRPQVINKANDCGWYKRTVVEHRNLRP